MNARMAVAVSAVLVVGIAVLWPRGVAVVEESQVESEPEPGVGAGGVGVFDGAATAVGGGSSSAVERIVAAANAASNGQTLWQSPDELLARFRSGELPPTLESVAGPRGPSKDYNDPAIMRNVGVWPKSPEERLAKLRAGEIPPTLDYVQGPPGKPRLLEGTPKNEVLAAWGPPVHVYPARSEPRGGQNEVLMEIAPSIPFETDRIEQLEAWQYSPMDDRHARQWHFDGDLLTARALTVESERALLIENELLRIRERERLGRD